MKVLVVGGGGREHAIIKSLKKNPEITALYALPGNGGIAADATCVEICAKEIEAVASFAAEQGIDFAVVAPDDPLVLGAVDALEEKGIPCFGPNRRAAILEGSKVFSKQLMKKYGIPRDEVFAKVKENNKRRRKLYDVEYVNYVYEKFGLHENTVLSELKSQFGSYSEFLRST